MKLVAYMQMTWDSTQTHSTWPLSSGDLGAAGLDAHLSRSDHHLYLPLHLMPLHPSACSLSLLFPVLPPLFHLQQAVYSALASSSDSGLGLVKGLVLYYL